MNVGNKLRNNFPKTVNKNGEIFGALVANNKSTGTFEKTIQNFIDFANSWTSTPNIYEQSDEMLDLTTEFLTYLERYTNETEQAYKKRINTIFVRGGTQIWGGPYDVINIFRSYFPSAKIYLVENVNSMDDNLIVDGDFQTKSNRWIGISEDSSSNCYYDRESRFSKSYGVKLKNNGEFHQTLELDTDNYLPYITQTDDTYKSIAKFEYGAEEKANYIKSANPNINEPLSSNQRIEIPALNVMFIHFFLKGETNVSIKSNTGKYWNPEVIFNKLTATWQIGKWQDEEFLIKKSAEDWDNQSIFFIADNTIESVDIQFNGTETESSIDYIRVFEKQKYSSFTIIAHFMSYSDKESAALFPRSEDEEITADIQNANYYDNDYLNGVSNGGYAQDLYEDLLDYVKAVGVKAYIEIVNMDV